MKTLNVSGVLDFSSVDYPGKISGVVWLTGCPLRCRFCQNSDVVMGRGFEIWSVDELKDKIMANFGFVEAVTFTGGEPSLQAENLLELIKMLRKAGLKIHLNTNGYFPEKLEMLLEYVDYVSMDVKTTADKYHDLTGVVDTRGIMRSVELILGKENLFREFRTTVVKGWNDDTIAWIAKRVADADLYVLNHFKNRDVMDEAFRSVEELNKDKMNELKYLAEKYVRAEVRGI